MIESKEYNNISFEPPRLKPGQRAMFRSAFGGGNKFKSDHIFGKHDLITTINDPKKGAVEIAFIVSASPDGKPPKLGTIEFLKSNKGVIRLNGDKPIDQHQYEYMMLADFNGSKPNRDETKPIYYYFVDQDRETRKQLDDAALLLEATKYALESPLEQLRADLISSGQNAKTWPEDMVRSKALNQYKAGVIKKVPSFAAKGTAANPNTDSIESKVRELCEAEMIRWDNKENKMVNITSEVIYTVPGLVKSTSDKPGAIIAHARKDPGFMKVLVDSLAEQ